MSIAARCAALPAATRRAIACLAAPALLALIAIALYLPAAQMHDAQLHWREDVKQLLARAQRAPAVQAALEKELEGMRQSALWSKLYATSGAMSPASALQTDVRTLFSTVVTGGEMLTPIAAEENSLFVRHGVRLTASLRVHQLQDVLNAIAQHPRFLQVGRLTVVAPQLQDPEQNPALAITMDIYGYALSKDKRATSVVAAASSQEMRP